MHRSPAWISGRSTPAGQPRLGWVGALQDLVRVEKIIAVARVYMAVAGLVAVYFDPTEPTRFTALTYSLLVAYAGYSFGVLALVGRV
jgi:hypothetical protein